MRLLKERLIPTRLQLLCGVVLLLLGLGLMHTPVTTRRGVDYEVQSFSMPLYLKALNFMSRHYNYQWQVGLILPERKPAKEEIQRLLDWTVDHVRPQPEQLPVIDDHVWDIIVRGYGDEDQIADVFATLCNYANYRAFFHMFAQPKPINQRVVLVFVEFETRWFIMDPSRGYVLEDDEGQWIELNAIKDGQRYHNKSLERYQPYWEMLVGVNPDRLYKTNRSAIQTPWLRFLNLL